MKRTLSFMLLSVVASAAFAGTAFLKSEKTSGFNKICFYDHVGSEVAITIKSTDLCPLTIEVK